MRTSIFHGWDPHPLPQIHIPSLTRNLILKTLYVGKYDEIAECFGLSDEKDWPVEHEKNYDYKSTTITIVRNHGCNSLQSNVEP